MVIVTVPALIHFGPRVSRMVPASFQTKASITWYGPAAAGPALPVLLCVRSFERSAKAVGTKAVPS